MGTILLFRKTRTPFREIKTAKEKIKTPIEKILSPKEFCKVMNEDLFFPVAFRITKISSPEREKAFCEMWKITLKNQSYTHIVRLFFAEMLGGNSYFSCLCEINLKKIQ